MYLFYFLLRWWKKIDQKIRENVTVDKKSAYVIYEWSLRGTEPCVQPDKKGENTLLWNGDLFNIDLPKGQSDTEYISNQLSEAKDAQSVRRIFSQLNGPGAYLYYRQSYTSQVLWTFEKRCLPKPFG